MNDNESSLSQLAFQVNELKKTHSSKVDSDNKTKLDYDPQENIVQSVIDRLTQLKDVLSDTQMRVLLNPCVVLVMAGMKPTSILYRDQLSDLPDNIQLFLGIKVNGTRISSTQSTERLFSRSLLLRSIIGQDINFSEAADITFLEDLLLDKLSAKFPGKENFPLRQIICDGIMLGYPDTSILDFAIAYRKDVLTQNRSRIDMLISSKTIEGNDELNYLTRYYGVPDFDFHPSHINSPDISSCIDAMNNAFKAFYNDPTITELCRELGIVKS